jgi:uncharacterized protein (UPF0332 family)
MTKDAARAKVVQHWLGMADEALASAESELAAGRCNFAANRAYYACFYSASAALLESGSKFLKHSGVRAAVHRDLVKTGRLDPNWGNAYDLAFDMRLSADYRELLHA